MTEILSLKSEDAKGVRLEALRWFNDQRAIIEREVPLEELSNDDLNVFLSDNERSEYNTYIGEIG